MTQRHSFLAPPKKNSAVLYYPSVWEYLKCLLNFFFYSREKMIHKFQLVFQNQKDFVL